MRHTVIPTTSTLAKLMPAIRATFLPLFLSWVKHVLRKQELPDTDAQSLAVEERGHDLDSKVLGLNPTPDTS